VNGDVFIIGAGPSGLAAGIASTKYLRGTVCIFERNVEPGRKFLLSGSGQCNVTHAGEIADFPNRYGSIKQARFVKPALFAFDNIAVMRFFEQHGVSFLEREDGKIFPKSLKSEDLLNVLITEFQGQGGLLQTETVVKNVSKIDTGFLLATNRGEFRAKKLILATGGQSYPSTGSQGDGFRFAEQLGHRIVQPKPALSPVIVRNYSFGGLSGISFWSANIEVHRNGKRLKSGQGDLLLTHRGLSGPGILNLSRNMKQGDELRVALAEPKTFVPNIFSGKKTLKNALQCVGLAERFLIQILSSFSIAPDQPVTETNRETRKKLESVLTGYPFVIESLGGWNEAMITSGGVVLEEVRTGKRWNRGLFPVYISAENCLTLTATPAVTISNSLCPPAFWQEIR
jgi:predicted Rossmann fold flavoprotein